MRKGLAMLLALVMLLGLTACGEKAGEKAPEEKPTLVGRWEYSVMEAAYVFHGDGTGAYVYYGVEMPFTYTDEGTAVTIQFTNSDFPESHNYTIQGKKLTITDSFGEPVEYVRGAYTAPVGTQTKTTQPEETQPEVTQPEQTQAQFTAQWWWEGQWYGWWAMDNARGIYAPLEDTAWDAYGVIEAEDDAGRILIWDSVCNETGTLVNCEVRYRGGKGQYGALDTASGRFFDSDSWGSDPAMGKTMALDEDDWHVDPADSTVSQFENMLEIKGHYTDPENSENAFDYVIYLRPWGTRWEDVREGNVTGCIYDDMMPPQYDSWYLPLLAKETLVMPESYGEGLRLLGKEQ